LVVWSVSWLVFDKNREYKMAGEYNSLSENNKNESQYVGKQLLSIQVSDRVAGWNNSEWVECALEDFDLYVVGKWCSFKRCDRYSYKV